MSITATARARPRRTLYCPVCEGYMGFMRRGAKSCSDPCRKALSRAKQRESLSVPVANRDTGGQARTLSGAGIQ